MPRPKHCRRVGILPHYGYLKPHGIPMRLLEYVGLTMDEFEAVRLADGEGLYQADAAEQMNISRQTFGRILDVAHNKIADALVHGKAIRIEGGVFQMHEDHNNDAGMPDPTENAPPPTMPGAFGRRRRCGHRHGQGGI
ncbi:MAG: DUF134 domain-containing protein [Sedimentisphaerales bacterium]|nr:DUF134 domain-containing protein [Sedimentisphaerales bacterium]